MSELQALQWQANKHAQAAPASLLLGSSKCFNTYFARMFWRHRKLDGGAAMCAPDHSSRRHLSVVRSRFRHCAAAYCRLSKQTILRGIRWILPNLASRTRLVVPSDRLAPCCRPVEILTGTRINISLWSGFRKFQELR